MTDQPDQLLNHMLRADRAAANALVDEWAGEHSYEQAITELLEPALAGFGRLWATDEDVNLAQGYMSAKIAEDIMAKAFSERSPEAAPDKLKGPVVIGNIEDDYHALGRKLIVTFLRLAGWDVIDMGNDVMAEEFVDRAVESGARVICVSAMMYITAVNIKKLRAEIDRRELEDRVQLAVGGAVFLLRPELVGEVGGDGTAPNALAVPELMDQLWGKALAAEQQRGLER